MPGSAVEIQSNLIEDLDSDLSGGFEPGLGSPDLQEFLDRQAEAERAREAQAALDAKLAEAERRAQEQISNSKAEQKVETPEGGSPADLEVRDGDFDGLSKTEAEQKYIRLTNTANASKMEMKIVEGEAHLFLDGKNYILDVLPQEEMNFAGKDPEAARNESIAYITAIRDELAATGRAVRSYEFDGKNHYGIWAVVDGNVEISYWKENNSESENSPAQNGDEPAAPLHSPAETITASEIPELKNSDDESAEQNAIAHHIAQTFSGVDRSTQVLKNSEASIFSSFTPAKVETISPVATAAPRSTEIQRSASATEVTSTTNQIRVSNQENRPPQEFQMTQEQSVDQSDVLTPPVERTNPVASNTFAETGIAIQESEDAKATPPEQAEQREQPLNRSLEMHKAKSLGEVHGSGIHAERHEVNMPAVAAESNRTQEVIYQSAKTPESTAQAVETSLQNFGINLESNPFAQTASEAELAAKIEQLFASPEIQTARVQSRQAEFQSEDQAKAQTEQKLAEPTPVEPKIEQAASATKAEPAMQAKPIEIAQAPAKNEISPNHEPRQVPAKPEMVRQVDSAPRPEPAAARNQSLPKPSQILKQTIEVIRAFKPEIAPAGPNRATVLREVAPHQTEPFRVQSLQTQSRQTEQLRTFIQPPQVQPRQTGPRQAQPRSSQKFSLTAAASRDRLEHEILSALLQRRESRFGAKGRTDLDQNPDNINIAKKPTIRPNYPRTKLNIAA